MANSFVADRRLYLTAKWDDPNARVVEEGNPDAAFLLVGEGGMVDVQTAERFGLTAEQYGVQTAYVSDPEPGPFARTSIVDPVQTATGPTTPASAPNSAPGFDQPKAPADPPNAPGDAEKVKVMPPSVSKAADPAEDKALSGPDSGAKK